MRFKNQETDFIDLKIVSEELIKKYKDYVFDMNNKSRYQIATALIFVRIRN